MQLLADPLPLVLEQPVSLTAHSDRKLCDGIRNTSEFKKAPNKKGAPPAKQPQPIQDPSTVGIRPIDLLQTLGVAMLPRQHVEQNLASWHWTLIRYGYLIETALPGSPLATNELVSDYRHHHMTAVSEAFGVGCALSYALGWLDQECKKSGRAFLHPPVDFDYLLDPDLTSLPTGLAGHMPSTAPNSTRQPDYLLSAQRPDGSVRLMIVECKGNSQGPKKAAGQLGSAMHQLESITFAGGPQPTVDRHAYAAYISKQGGQIQLFGVDPPDESSLENDKHRWSFPRRASREDRTNIGRRDEEGRVSLPAIPLVAGRALQASDDVAAAWAGAGGRAEEADIEAMERESSAFGDLAGATSSFRFPDGRRIEVFSGTLVELLQAAREGDDARARTHRGTLRDTLEVMRDPRAGARLDQDADPEREASAIDQWGTALRIRWS